MHTFVFDEYTVIMYSIKPKWLDDRKFAMRTELSFNMNIQKQSYG